MPNTRNAAKALRQNHKRRLRNRSQRTSLRTVLKKFQATVATDDATGKDEAFRLATKVVDQAAAKGLIHKNKAARTKSRMAKKLQKTAADA